MFLLQPCAFHSLQPLHRLISAITALRSYFPLTLLLTKAASLATTFS